jgi:hypothetical protein
MTAAVITAYVLIVVTLSSLAVIAAERIAAGRGPRHGRTTPWRRLQRAAGVFLVSSASAIPDAGSRPDGRGSAVGGWVAAPAAAAAAWKPIDPLPRAAAAPIIGYPTLDGRTVYMPFLGPRWTL